MWSGRSEGLKRVLLEAKVAALGVVKRPQAAQAVLDVLIVPGAGKQRAVGFQGVDEARDLGVAKGVAEIGAELGEQAAGPILPVRDEGARGLLKEDKPQEVALIVTVEPAAKECLGRLVPATGGPKPVQPVGGMRSGVDRGKQRGRCVALRLQRQLGVQAAGQLEQVGPLRAAECERLSQAG